MEENEFKKRFPRLFEAIINSQKEYDLYGLIKFKTHSYLQYLDFVNRIEHQRQFVYYKFKINGDCKRIDADLFMMNLN